MGADASFLKAAEDEGKVFKDKGKAKPGLEIFKDHSSIWARLRIFDSPTDLSHLAYTMGPVRQESAMQLPKAIQFCGQMMVI
jgi:arabinogalactan endo-1,4-beta-galactosidase